MKKHLIFALGFLIASTSAFAELKIGEAAPDFTLTDSNGKTHSLKDFAGKPVVLEWFNHDCPFVRKHYDTGNMQKLQEEETKNGVVWLKIISSVPGTQGHLTPKQANERLAKEKSKATALLLDTDGKVGKAYDAKTTPHMYVIDSAGKLAYQGAIDDKPSTDKEDVATAKNYVKAALEDLRAKRTVAMATTKAYGCGVKYKK